MKSTLIIFLLMSSASLTSCIQNDNKYLKETSKLITLINKEDTVGIQSLIVCRLEDTKFLKFTLWHDIKKYNKLISRFGIPENYVIEKYPEGNTKACDIIVKVGNDVDFGILTASFYRNYEPDRIFLFDFRFDTNIKGVISSPPFGERKKK